MTARDAILSPVVLACCVLAAVIAVPVLLAERVLPKRVVDRAGHAVSWLVDGWRW